MLKNILVFAASASVGNELVSKANALAENTVLVTSTEGLSGADLVYTYGAAESVAQKLGAMADLAREIKPELVLCEASAGGRLVAGYLAAVLGTCTLPEAMSIEVSEAGVKTGRMVYGGSAVRIESTPFPAVVTVGAGICEAQDNMKNSEVRELSGLVEGIELLNVEVSAASTGNLAGAKKVVTVGRGLGSAEKLPMVEELAGLMGAELGCTRPVAEEEHWFPKEKYIGISGLMLKPVTYLGLGVSGQMQHMIGVQSAENIFAINRNENAGIIDEADYTLVGSIDTAVPVIIEKLKA